MTAVITLTLAIGANSAIFTLANALIFASLPVTHPERLVEIYTGSKRRQERPFDPRFRDLTHQDGIFSVRKTINVLIV